MDFKQSKLRYHARPRGYTCKSVSSSKKRELSTAKKEMLKIIDFTSYKLPRVLFTLPLNVQIPVIVDILTFTSRIKNVFSVITAQPGL